MSVLVGTQEVLKLHNKEPGKARPANREQSAVEGCPRVAYGGIGGLLPTTRVQGLAWPPAGWSANRKLPSDWAVYDTGFAILSSVNHSPILLGTSSFTAK